jgi:UDP-N-acetylglucosamine 2-epimerase (non-hydrolysing)
LVGTDPLKVVPAAREILAGRAKKGGLPEYWDGRAAERIADILIKFCEGRV